jgi:hypothetical protein
MADKKIALDLEVNIKKGDMTLGELNKQLETLGTTIDEQKEILIEFERELLELESIQSKTSKTDLARQTSLKEKSEQLKGAIKDQKLSIKELTTEKNKAATASKDLAKDTAGEADAIQALDGVTGGAATKFQNLRGVLGKVANSFTTLKGAIAASGIGLLALAVAAVGAAFTSSEEGQNKFAKLMGVIGAVTGNFVDLLADLGEKIIKTFENPKKAVEDFSKLIKDNIVNRFEGLTELIPQLGEAINLLFKGQFSAAGKVAADAVGKVGLGVENITDKIGGAIEKTKEFAAEQAKEARQAAKVADMRAKADKIDRDLIVSRSKLESQIAGLRLKARQEDQFSAAERRAALLKAQELENTLLDSETKALVLRRDAQILENTFSRTNKENLTKEAQARAAVNNQVAARAGVARELQRELNAINGQIEAADAATKAKQEAADKELAAAKEAIRQGLINTEAQRRQEELDAVDRQYKALIELAKGNAAQQEELAKVQQAKKDAIIKKNADADAAAEKAKTDKTLKEQEDLIKSLEIKQEQDKNDFEIRRAEVDRREKILLEDKTLTDEQRSNLEKQFAAERLKISNEEEVARGKIFEQRLQIAGNILGAINGLTQAFAKEDEASQKKAFKLNKAFGIGQAIISTAVGISNALTAGGNPIKLATGTQFVEAGIVAATGAAQIATIAKSQFGGGANITSPTAPTLASGGAGASPVGFTQNLNNTQIPTTKVIVTETDIRRATRNIDGIYNKAVVVE